MSNFFNNVLKIWQKTGFRPNFYSFLRWFGFGQMWCNEVVSIGVNHTFKVIFTPVEYIPTMSKRLHFFGSRFLLLILRHQCLCCTFQAKQITAIVRWKPNNDHLWCYNHVTTVVKKPIKGPFYNNAFPWFTPIETTNEPAKRLKLG